MIVVIVELWPGGDPARKRHLGTAKIANDGRGTLFDGDYNVTLLKNGRPNQVWRKGRVEGFPRRRLGAWDLLYRALSATVGSRNVAAAELVAEDGA